MFLSICPSYFPPIVFTLVFVFFIFHFLFFDHQNTHGKTFQINCFSMIYTLNQKCKYILTSHQDMSFFVGGGALLLCSGGGAFHLFVSSGGASFLLLFVFFHCCCVVVHLLLMLFSFCLIFSFVFFHFNVCDFRCSFASPCFLLICHLTVFLFLHLFFSCLFF